MLAAVALGDLPPGGVEGGARQRGAVGAHVGDVAVLVEGLRVAHRLLGRHPQLATGLLLERRGDERRRRSTPVGLALDRSHRERHRGQVVGQRVGGDLVEPHEVVVGEATGGVEVASGGDAALVDGDERGREGGPLRGGEQPVDVPVPGDDERHALALALDDEAHGHALDPTRRQTGRDLLPQDRRHLVAVEAIEDAPRLLGVDQAAVELAGVGDGLLDGLRGDLVEHHPSHGHVGRRVEHLEQVPGDGLALAILVRREVELVGGLQRLAQALHDVVLAGADDVQGLEVVVDVDAEVGPLLALERGRHVLGPVGEVTDVPDRRFDRRLERGAVAHLEAIAEETGDRLRLGRRLDDDQGTGHRRTGFRQGFSPVNRGLAAPPPEEGELFPPTG